MKISLSLDAATLAGLDHIITLLQALQTKYKPVRLALALPIITRKDGTVMANFQLKNDTAADILITTVNDAGAIVPAPAGDVDSVVSSDPTKLAATIATMPSGAFAGAPSLHLMPVMKGPFVGTLTATLTDSAGLRQDIIGVDIVEDTTATAVSVDFANVVLTPQAVPAT